MLFLVPELPLGNARFGSSASRSTWAATDVTPLHIDEISTCGSLDESRSGASERGVTKLELGNEGEAGAW